MQTVRGGQLLAAGQDDLIEPAVRDQFHRAGDRPPEEILVPGLSHCHRAGGRPRHPLREVRRRVVKRVEFAVGTPDLGCERVEIGRRFDEKVGHGDGALGSARHLPARHKQPNRRKRLAALHLVEEREGPQKMRAAERPRHLAHRNGARQRVVDEFLAGGKSRRAVRLEREHRLRAGHGPALRRTLGVEMWLRRFEDRLEHGQRVKRLDLERDAHQPRTAVARRRGAALRQKRAQRLRRGIGGRIEGQDGHGSAPSGKR